MFHPRQDQAPTSGDMRLRCLASTQETLHGSAEEAIDRETGLHQRFLDGQAGSEYTYPALQQRRDRSSHHTHITPTALKWLSDGSSLLSVADDGGIRTYIASPTLVEDDNEALIPYTRTFHSSRIIAAEVHPGASPYAGVCPALVSGNDVPLKLIDALPAGDDGKASVMSVYNTQHNHTEQYFKIHALKFTSPTTFVAGMSRDVLLFDLNRSGPTGNIRCPGIVSCFETVRSGFANGGVYTGSFSNCVRMFNEDGTKAMETKLGTGNGVTQIVESHNGKYVFVVTRNNDVIEVLDVRMGLQSVCQLSNFHSESQRLHGDILPNSQGFLIGTADGCLNFYEDAEMGRDVYQTTVLTNETSIPSVVVNPKDPSIIAYSMGDRDYSKPEICIACLE